MKKYRIKTAFGSGCFYHCFLVQVRAWWGVWVTVKRFDDPLDPDYAQREAEELLDKLND